MGVQALLNMRTVFFRRLDEESTAQNVPDLEVHGKDDVAQLLNSAELVEGGLIQELFH